MANSTQIPKSPLPWSVYKSYMWPDGTVVNAKGFQIDPGDYPFAVEAANAYGHLRELIRRLLPLTIQAGLSDPRSRALALEAAKAIGDEANKLSPGHRAVLAAF